MNAAVFLDRDGVINVFPGKGRYVTRPGEFRLLPRVAAALKELRRKGYRLYVVSNQAGVAKKRYSRQTLEEITHVMTRRLGAAGARLDGIFYCTHRSSDNCRCRKPRTGLIRAAVRRAAAEGIRLSLKSSYFVGDSQRDILAGRRAGMHTVLVRSHPLEEPAAILPERTVDSLHEAARIIPRLAGVKGAGERI